MGRPSSALWPGSPLRAEAEATLAELEQKPNLVYDFIGDADHSCNRICAEHEFLRHVGLSDKSKQVRPSARPSVRPSVDPID